MKLSDWLDTFTASHDIYTHVRIAESFKRHTGFDANWPAHTVSETKVVLNSRGLGGTINGNDSDIVAWGWEIACAVARQHVPGYKPGHFGRGRLWQAALDALKAAGL